MTDTNAELAEKLAGLNVTPGPMRLCEDRTGVYRERDQPYVALTVCGRKNRADNAEFITLCMNHRDQIIAALRPTASQPAPEVVERVACEVCMGRTFERVDARIDGRFQPGPHERCVGCKATRSAALPPEAPKPASEGALREALMPTPRRLRGVSELMRQFLSPGQAFEHQKSSYIFVAFDGEDILAHDIIQYRDALAALSAPLAQDASAAGERAKIVGFLGQDAFTEHREVRANPDGMEAASMIERLHRYVAHDVGCSANELDPLDDTPCKCGLRAVLTGRKHDG